MTVLNDFDMFDWLVGRACVVVAFSICKSRHDEWPLKISTGFRVVEDRCRLRIRSIGIKATIAHRRQRDRRIVHRVVVRARFLWSLIIFPKIRQEIRRDIIADIRMDQTKN